MWKKRRAYLVSLVIIFIAGAGFRLYKPLWDSGYGLHPDERLYVKSALELGVPTSLAAIVSPDSPLNPHMFYYGSFPLYVYTALWKIATSLPFVELPAQDISSFLLVSRTVSGIVSCLTLALVYFLSRRISGKQAAWFTLAVFAFAVGPVQYAHFNTTESFLTLFATLLAYLSVLLYQARQADQYPRRLTGIGAVLGLAIGTKIVGLSLAITPLTALALAVWRLVPAGTPGKRLAVFARLSVAPLVVLSASTLATAFLSSPYDYLDRPAYLADQVPMRAITSGSMKAPFTILYEDTVPYLYQFQHVLPWLFSVGALALAAIGLTVVVRNAGSARRTELLVVSLWPLVYVAEVGAWYAKYARYMVPVLPFLALLAGAGAAMLWSRGRVGKGAVVILVAVHTLVGLGFFHGVYGATHTRVRANAWALSHIPPGSTVGYEYWDDPFPYTNTSRYRLEPLDMYAPDTPETVSGLRTQLASLDYFVISSRRVRDSILHNPDNYPRTGDLYRQLADGSLGFRLAHSETQYPTFLSWPINDDTADETFQSYDHPPVLIYERQARP